MNKFAKAALSLFLCFIIIAGTNTNAFALTIDAKAAILMNANTGEVVFEHNADELLIPASMAKLMTVYIMLDQVKQGNISLDTVVTISSEVSVISKNAAYTNVPLQENQGYTMDQLLESIVTVSACGSAKAVAEYFSGSEVVFAQQMNDYAKTLGLNAVFVDSAGISLSNYITARSMAILSMRLITEFPEVLNYAKKSSMIFEGKTYYCTNKMLEGMPQSYYGMDGLKTGSISEAKYCFAGTAQREDVRFISIVMGAENLDDRCEQTAKLLDYGFETQNISLPWKYAQANPSTSRVLVDGRVVPFEVYDIEDSHYFNLRDVAAALNNTKRRFNVEWHEDQFSILLHTQKPYHPVGGELSGAAKEIKEGMAINAKIQLNGKTVRLTGYDISGEYFFELRDIAKAINIDVIWDDADKTIRMSTNS